MRATAAFLCLLPVFAGAAFAQPVLVGVARVPADALDSQGETLGGFGSGMMLKPGSWKKTANGFTAKLYMLPDRGWNTAGTTDYRARLQKFDMALTPDDGNPGIEGQLKLAYKGALLLTDNKGVATTGLDPVGIRPAQGALPDLPVAANGHVSLDDEAVAPAAKGGFWVSDEYGPYIYRYDGKGRMTSAIRPPDAFIPMRDGKENFSSNNPPTDSGYDSGNPTTGRQNNQGFEGMSVSRDGRTLFVINQSALRQDLDPADAKATRRNVRLLAYDIAGKTPRLIHEYAVQLPTFRDGAKTVVAAQSEMLAIDDHRLLLLCRDSGGGFASKRPNSLYRKIEMLDLRGATDIVGKYDGMADSIAPQGVLRATIAPVVMSDFVDLNDNSQLNRFGLRNGAPADNHDLYEKWESLALGPTGNPGEYILLVGSDNDFETQHGHMAGRDYKDDSGADVDTLVMAWRVRLPD